MCSFIQELMEMILNAWKFMNISTILYVDKRPMANEKTAKLNRGEGS